MRRRHIVLSGLAAVGLLLAVFFATQYRFGPAEVRAKQWTGLNNPYFVAIGDYNGDGLNDLAFSETYGGGTQAGEVEVWKSDGTMIGKPGLTIPTGVAIGDYDNDGSNDLAYAEWGHSGEGVVSVWKSDGITVIKYWSYLSRPMGVAIGDYDNDGLNDLAFAETVSPGTGRVTVIKSDGTTMIKQWNGLNGPYGVAIGDYDNDGLNELAFTESGGGSAGKVTVYRSDGTMIKKWTLTNGAYGVAIGDCNNDGLNELAFTETSSTGKLNVYKSDGITITQQWTPASMAYGIAIGDYNNDGLNDLAFTEYNAGRMTVYYQTKLGTAAKVAEPTIVTLGGTLTDSGGSPIPSGSIRVTIKDSLGAQVWQDTFDNCIDNGKYNLPLGAKTTLKLIKGQIYNAILEVDADSATFVSADVIFGDNNPVGDVIKFVAS